MGEGVEGNGEGKKAMRATGGPEGSARRSFLPLSSAGRSYRLRLWSLQLSAKFKGPILLS